MTYKVIQWATGSVGMWSLKEIVRNPDLDLVGLRVYSRDKVGRDAGEIAGADHLWRPGLLERLDTAVLETLGRSVLPRNN